MTLRVVFHELAESELNEAAAYYAGARRGLGEAFVAAVERTVEVLAASPFSGEAVEGEIRRWQVRRFRYCVFYRTHGDHVRILAVGHQKRRPFYWCGRA